MIIYTLIVLLIVFIIYIAIAKTYREVEAFSQQTVRTIPSILKNPNALQCNKDLNYTYNANAKYPCIYEWEKPYYVGNSKINLKSADTTWIGENNIHNLLQKLESNTAVCANSVSTVKSRLDAELSSIKKQYVNEQTKIRYDVENDHQEDESIKHFKQFQKTIKDSK